MKTTKNNNQRISSSSNRDECKAILKQIPAMSLKERKTAILLLLRNCDPDIRAQAQRMGSVFFSEQDLIGFLHDDADDVIRNAGLEMLKLRGTGSFNAALKIIGSKDPDVVVQGILILDHIRDMRAYEPLKEILSGSDQNLVHAAIVAIGHLGDMCAVPDILPFLEREQWLQIAAIKALGDLRAKEAVPALKKLLHDRFLAPLVRETITKIMV